MGVPPTPSNPYDAGNAAAGGSSTTSSTVDIWGLGDYGKQTVVFGSAVKRRTGFGGYYKLPGEDREGRAATPRPAGSYGPYADNSVPGAAVPTAGDSLAVTPTIAELMKYFAGLAYTPKGGAEFEKYQRLLYQAGFYGAAKPDEVAWGSWAGSESAFKSALISASQAKEGGAPVSFEEYLGKAGVDRAKGAGQQAATPHQLTNPRVIASVLQQTAQNVLGRNLSKDEVEHFVSDYTATEEEYFKAVDASGNGGAPNVYQPPSVDTAAQDTVQEQHGAEAGGNRASDYLGVLEQLLGQGSLPAPQGAPVPVRP